MTPLIFTGQQPVSFLNLSYLGEVVPGPFEARDADAELLLLRADVRHPEAIEATPLAASTVADSLPKPRKSATPKSPEAPAADPSPTTA